MTSGSAHAQGGPMHPILDGGRAYSMEKQVADLKLDVAALDERMKKLEAAEAAALLKMFARELRAARAVQRQPAKRKKARTK